MFKKAMMLAVAAAALAALAVPGTASAKWAQTVQHGGQIIDIGQNEGIQVTGQAEFQGQAGQVKCEFLSAAQLDSKTTTATANFNVDNNGAANDEDKCSVGGALITVGCTDVEQVTVEGTFEAHAVSTTTIDVTTGTIQNHLTGGALCPKTLQLTPGTVHIKTAAHWWHLGQLEGTLQLHTIPGGGTTSQVTIGGSGTVNPASTFGMTP